MWLSPKGFSPSEKVSGPRGWLLVSLTTGTPLGPGACFKWTPSGLPLLERSAQVTGRVRWSLGQNRAVRLQGCGQTLNRHRVGESPAEEAHFLELPLEKLALNSHVPKSLLRYSLVFHVMHLVSPNTGEPLLWQRL